MDTIKASIIGATGYAGAELARLLLGHPQVTLLEYGSKSYAGQPFAGIYGNLRSFVREDCSAPELDQMAEEADVVFTATPQGYLSGILTEDVLNKTKVIDLSADYRIKDVQTYEAWYQISHKSPQLIQEAVYGLCEINREKIRPARVIANPGCYTTCSMLSAYPLVAEKLIRPETLVIDAKSGTSGAGRGAKTANLYCEVNESMKAYGVARHRHTPEIEEQLSYAAGKDVVISFTPHLAPMNRGILVTAYASLADETIGRSQIEAAYEKYFGSEYFIRLLPEGVCPETRWVEGSNFVDIGFVVDPRTKRVVIMAALDNLVKGAAGQAVQNMNLLFGFAENAGLQAVPLFP